MAKFSNKITKYLPEVKLITIGIAALITIMSASTGALAQESGAAEQTLEEMVVFGIRNSIKSSTEVKKNADSVIDAITAEDVGKFPDSNVLEAMQRITGVQISRDEAGDGAAFQIRGITQNRVSLNGRTPLGGEGEGRNLNLSDIPAELISSLEIVKSPTADMVEGSLGATINLKTARPFNFRKNKRVFNIKAKYGDNIEEWFGNYNALLSQRWNTGLGEVGALVNVVFNENRNAGDVIRMNHWSTRCPSFALTRLNGKNLRGNGLPQGGNINNCNTIESKNPGSVTQRLFSPGQVSYAQYEEERDRFAVNTALQWAPTENSEYLFEVAVYEKENLQARDIMRLNLIQGRDLIPTDLFNGQANGFVFDGFQNVMSGPREFTRLNERFELDTSQAVNPVMPVEYAEISTAYINSSAAQGERKTTEGFSLAMGGEWNFDKLSIESEFNFSKSEHERHFTQVQLSDYRGNPTNQQNHTLRLSNPADGIQSSINDVVLDLRDPRLVNLDWRGFDLTDPRYFRHNAARDDGWIHEPEEWAFKTDFDWDLDIMDMTTLEFGMRITDREFVRSSRFRFACVRNSNYGGNGPNSNSFVAGDRDCTDPSVSTVELLRDYPDAFQITTGVFDKEAVSPIAWLQPNSRLHFDNYGRWKEVWGFNDTGNDSEAGFIESPDETYRINEETAAFYVKLNLEGDLFNALEYRANIGVRAVQTDMEAVVFRDNNGVIDADPEQSGANDYSNTLPSANVALLLNENNIIRFAAARVMVRPTFSDLKPAANFNFFSGCRPVDLSDPLNPPDAPDSAQENDIDNNYVNGSTACPGVRSLSTNRIGNFNLDPYTSDNYEISFEHYWGDNSNSATITFFQRDVDADLQDRVVVVERDIPAGVTEFASAAVPGKELWLTKQKVNAPPSTRQGIEASYTHFLDFLPSPFDGFGISANYTYAEGERSPPQYIDAGTQAPTTADDPNSQLLDRDSFQPLKNLSENSYNVSLFYEKYSLSARLAYTYRNEYFAGDRFQWEYISPIDRLDLSTSYRINRRTKLIFNVENLTRHLRHHYDLDPMLTREVRYSDVRYTVGLNVNLDD